MGLFLLQLYLKIPHLCEVTKTFTPFLSSTLIKSGHCRPSSYLSLACLCFPYLRKAWVKGQAVVVYLSGGDGDKGHVPFPAVFCTLAIHLRGELTSMGQNLPFQTSLTKPTTHSIYLTSLKANQTCQWHWAHSSGKPTTGVGPSWTDQTQLGVWLFITEYTTSVKWFPSLAVICTAAISFRTPTLFHIVHGLDRLHVHPPPQDSM